MIGAAGLNPSFARQRRQLGVRKRPMRAWFQFVCSLYLRLQAAPARLAAALPARGFAMALADALSCSTARITCSQSCCDM